MSRSQQNEDGRSSLWETEGIEHKGTRSGALEPGQTLGRYVVLYRLGTGGMGIVYAAYDPQLDRKVALKLLRHLSSNPKRRKRATERLLREARSMARLAHANVITVHDVAVFDGRIFVAMEHVDGITLTRHLSGGETNWGRSLEILTSAGLGLSAAHEAGLIHRDFKPDNVMLGRDGRVLVMDFGLARAMRLENESGVSDVGTEGSSVLAIAPPRGKAPASRVAGTPGYMAPEQHRGQPTDARTDQFSFCVTLFEALYRIRPFKGETPDEISDEIEAGRIQEPPLNHGVPGWLRPIIARGLRPRPEDRWDSMSQLLAALKKDPAINRRRWLVWGGSAGLAGGAVATVGMIATSPSAQCEPSAALMEGVWDDDQRAKVEAAFGAVDRPYGEDALHGATQGLDRYAEAWLAMHKNACEANRIRQDQSDDLFDLRMDCLVRRHSELRALTDLFAEADASIVKEAVLATSKLPAVAACADAQLLRATVPMPEDPNVRASVTNIREGLARSRAYEDGARYEQALELVASVVEDARSVDYPPVLAEALVRHGEVLRVTGDLREAEATLREGLRQASAGRHDEVAATAWIALARTLSQLGRLERTAEATEAAEAAVLRAGNPPGLAAWVANLEGTIAFGEGHFAKAQVAFENGLVLQQEAFGKSHPSVARYYNNIALAYSQQGDLVESTRYLRRALELEERSLGAVHPRVARIVGNLGAIEAQRGNLDRAEELSRRADDIYAQSNPDDPSRAMLINNLGEFYLQRRKPTEAKAEFLRAVQAQQSTIGHHPDLALSLINLGASLTELGDHEDALATIDRATTILRATTGTESSRYALAQGIRGRVQNMLGRHEAAAEQLEPALRRLEQTTDAALAPELGWMRFELACALVGAAREPERARQLAAAAHAELSALPQVPVRRMWLDRIAAWQAQQPATGKK